MDLGFPVIAIAVVIVVIYFLSSIKILAEYERGVIFRLGRLMGQAKGPGVILVFSPIDRMVRDFIFARKRWRFLRRTSSPATT
jgi:regulator of protease activity HflC (stomatin/prohibitin superfamily)